MPTTTAKPTGLESKLIVPESAFQALQQLARSRRLAAPPGLMLDFMLKENGIFFAGWIPSSDYEHVKTLHIPTPTFERLKYIQSKLNVGIYNLTLMDIVVANLIILGTVREQGKMIGSVQESGISPTIRGAILEHYDLGADTTDWRPTA